MRSLTEALLDGPAPTWTSTDQASFRVGLELRLSSGPELRAACGRLGPRDLTRPTAGRRVPFSWTARGAGRVLGLAGAAAVVGSVDRALAPAEAVAVELAALRRPTAGGYGSSLESWARNLTDGAAAVVTAEATTWCTRLVAALDWEQVGPGVEFGYDRWWRPSDSPRIALRAKADLLVPITLGSSGASAALIVFSGCPTTRSRLALAFTGLVSVLDRRTDDVPARVVGFWPDCGRWQSATVDRTTLDETVEATVAAVASLSRRRRRKLA